MNRKTKILLAIICVAAGIGFVVFFASESEGELKLTVTAAASNHVSVRLTNTSSTKFDYSIEQRVNPTNSFVRFIAYFGSVSAHSEKSFELPVQSMNRWHFEVAYGESLSVMPVARLRYKVSDFALKHHLDRFALTIRPLRKTKGIHGPVMLGNKPAPPEQK